MARLAGKMRGDMRAMEEQSERMNPVRGRGATPSMGLSQFRGGGESESDEEMVGGGFLSDLGIPVISNLAGAIGLGHPDGRVVGAGTKKGQRRKTARLAYEGMGTGAGTGGMSEATQMGLHLGRHLHQLHGAGFFDDFKKGFMSVISPVAGVAKSLLPLAGPEGMAASGVLNAIGLGKQRRRGRGKLTITHGGATNSDTGAYYGKGRESDDMAMMGMGTGAGLLGQDGHGIRQGGGFLSDLGIPVISNLAGAIGLGHGGDGTGAGRRRRAPAGPSDGRRKRAEVVKKVMAEKGLSMIEASKFVKAHGLY